MRIFAGNKYLSYLCSIKIKRASNALVRRLTPTATACHRSRWCERGENK